MENTTAAAATSGPGSRVVSASTARATPHQQVPPPHQQQQQQLLQYAPPVPGFEEKLQQQEILANAEVIFRGTLESVGSDEALNLYRQDYEKLYRSLVRSVAKGKRAYDQFAQLHFQYHEQAHNNQLLHASTTQDEHFIKNLQHQIRRANDFLESSKVKEEKSKDELRQLRVEVNDLKTTLQQGVGLSSSQERNINELMRAKDDATKELEKEINAITQLRAYLSDTIEKIREGDTERRTLEQDIHTLKEQNAQRRIDVDADLRNKERLEQDLRDMRANVSLKVQELRQKQDMAGRISGDITMLETQIKSQRQLHDKMAREHNALLLKTQHYRHECDEQAAATAIVIDRRAEVQRELSRKEDDLNKIQQDVDKALKLREAIAKKMRQLELKRSEAEAHRRGLRATMDETLSESDKIRRDIEADKKLMEDLVRERAILSQDYKKLMTEAEREHHLSVIYSQTRRTLEMQQAHCEHEIVELTRVYETVLAERDNYANEMQSIQEQATQAFGELKQKEAAILKHKRQMVEADTKLKHQQNLYDGVQSERNLHAKHLVDTQAQISEMKRLLKVMNFQINGYKEEIHQKTELITREGQDFSKLENEKLAIDEEIKTLKQQNELALAYARTQVAEESKLGQYLKEAEAERMRQEHALSMVVSERDQLSAQLTKLEGELNLVYDKIKTQQFALNRSQKHYFERLKEYRKLRQDIADMRQMHAMLEVETADSGLIRNLVHQLHADMLREQAQIKYLEEELKNPINIHRWRKLEGSDPKSLELIQLVQSLQRKLIAKGKEDKEKEALIHARECVYLQLKNIAGKQVGPEILEQVGEMEKVLKSNNDKLRRMNIELDMYRAQMKETQYAIHTLDRQLGDLKKVYFDARRKVVGQQAQAGHDREDEENGAAGVHYVVEGDAADVGDIVDSTADQDQPLQESARGDDASVMQDAVTAATAADHTVAQSPPTDQAAAPLLDEKSTADSDLPLLPGSAPLRSGSSPSADQPSLPSTAGGEEHV
ncbi:hypothetical protein RI367_000290 [Sorochytrium milnesiophthora]